MDCPIWQYNEPDHPGADFDAMAEAYDLNMKKHRDIQGEIGEILSFLDLKPDQTVLEFGCGTGEFALAASGLCSRVYAVDLSVGMLAYARKKALDRGITNVDFLHGGFLTYEHKGDPVDAVVTQMALHHLPDFWQQIALIRIAGMLKDGGLLCLRDVVFSFEISRYKECLDMLLAQCSTFGGEEFASMICDHVKNEYSTFDWIMEGMMKRAGFEIIHVFRKYGFLCLYQCCKKPLR
jgi:ubiquinone/menaquinone biosynthesis C-methylase UbiE